MPASDNLLRPKIFLKDKAGSTTYHTYNAFDTGAADIKITGLELTDELFKAPEAIIDIEDSGNTLNANVKNGCKVIIELGKTNGGLTRAFAGFVRGKQVFRNKTGTFDMKLFAYGTQIRFNERISNFFRMADRTSLSSANPDLTDTTMRASEVMIDLVSDTDHLPIGEPAESVTTGSINTITEVIPSIRMPFAEWSAIANHINDSVGTIWGVNENESVYMRYPTLSSSGLTIKDWTTQSAHEASSANTVYFIGGWSFYDSIQKSEGFSNRLYGRGGDELAIDQTFGTDAASTKLHDRDLAIKIAPTVVNFDALSLVLSKVGTVSTNIQGEIRLDSAGQPTGQVIGSFQIPIADVSGSATRVLATASLRADQKIQADKNHWLVLKSIGADASNTVQWHRGTDSSGTNAYYTGGSWTVQTSSYTFNYATMYNRKVLAEASDPDSIETYGVIESVIDAPWIVEGRTMDKYLGALLQWTAKPKRIYEVPVCTVPDSLIFAGYTCELVDAKAGFTTGNNAEILQRKYVFNSKTSAIGTKRMSLKLLQYPDNETLTGRT